MGYIITSNTLNNQHFHLSQLWTSLKVMHFLKSLFILCQL